MAGGLPADACWFPRPFAAEFDDCPVYVRRRYVPADSRQRPMQPIWMCGHLVVKAYSRRGALHHYGACELGDAGVRSQLARHQRSGT